MPGPIERRGIRARRQLDAERYDDGLTRKTRFRLSPELGDGVNCEVVDSPEAVLDRVREWLDEFGDQAGGESFSVDTVEMTDAEFEALREL